VAGTCVIGLQWGDEAKGKLVDLLTNRFDVVVRYQGGSNAGHTVVHGDETYKLHLIPSGILNSDVANVIASGVVLNPPTILEEIRGLVERGVQIENNLQISDRVHVVFPWHIAEDRLMNDLPVSGESIGTTLRGIGPCYRDKVGRSFAVRLGDMYRDSFRDRVNNIVAAKQTFLSGLNKGVPVELDADAIFEEFSGYAKQLEPYVRDTTAFLLDEVEADKKILFEGAQGALLDIDHGTFPFVTSSNSSGVGVSAGSGIPGRWINKVIGVAKAYTTRVGGGPFPTEQDNEVGQEIRDLGNEYGTTTGRPRRCGWFDAVAVRYTARLSGVDCI
jgi:adenylosuccinate synthase